MSINAHLPTCPLVAAVATVTSGAAAISLIIVDGAAVPHAFTVRTFTRQNTSSLTRSKAIDACSYVQGPPPIPIEDRGLSAVESCGTSGRSTHRKDIPSRPIRKSSFA
jgi:hypothetical protein